MASAHNLLAALVDNAVYRNAVPGLDASGISWARVTDASDRALRQIITGLGGDANSPLQETRVRHSIRLGDHGYPGAGSQPGGPAGADFPHGGGHYQE